jgi:hypothetical protein
MRARGLDDPALELARTLYRRAWFINQLALRRAAGAVGRLHDAGIEVLVLKGVALAVLHYDDLGARPMQDVDLLVDPARAADAVAALGGLGYRVLASEGPGNGPLKYGTHVEDADGNEIDVHAYALMQSAGDADLWEAPVPLHFGGVEALALAPAEQLLHVCAHGVRWSNETPTGWIADAMAILRSAGAAGGLDWDRLVDRAGARRLTAAVGSALAWLRESLEADVPGWVPARLQAAPKLRFEEPIHRLTTAAPTAASFAIYSWDRYRRFARLAQPGLRPRSFVAYLQHAWELDSPARLLAHGGRKLLPRAAVPRHGS